MLNKDAMQMKKRVFIPYKLLPLTTLIGTLVAIAVILILIIFVSTVPLDYNIRAKTVSRIVIQLIITGGALGSSSYLLQRIAKNRFADVSILGIGTINLIILCALAMNVDIIQANEFEKLKNQESYSFIIASCLLAIFFFLIARQRENFNYKKLILMGVILTFFLYAMAQTIKGWLDFHTAQYVAGKIIGTASQQTDTTIIISGTIVIVGLVYLLINSYKLQLIVTNQQLAKQLGVKINFHLFMTLAIIGAMVGASYSLSGDFVYIGLIAGNAAMRRRNNNLGFGTINAAMFGIIATLLTYWISVPLINLEVEKVGALVPIIMGPYFIYRVIRA
ncbi:iron ABC transporter permease [Ureaplasma diversum]|nr:iron ABC transporter permease [Ureaplasma diversum]